MSLTFGLKMFILKEIEDFSYELYGQEICLKLAESESKWKPNDYRLIFDRLDRMKKNLGVAKQDTSSALHRNPFWFLYQLDTL